MMTTSADRLRWFIEFAQRFNVRDREWDEPITAEETKEFKAWEYLKLKDEILQFIGGSDPTESFRFGLKREPVEYDDYGPIYSRSTRTFRENLEQWLTNERINKLSLQAAYRLGALWTTETPTLTEPIELLRFKKSVTIGPGVQFDSASKVKLNFKKVPNELREVISFGSPTVSFHMHTATWFIESTPSQLFFIRFGLALMERGTSEIQSCPECDRVFYRIRKQKYCSKTCINRVSRRKWLNDPKNKKKERQWAQKRYKRRVQEKTSNKVRVESRRKGGKNI
jgi:hypothetical protein